MLKLNSHCRFHVMVGMGIFLISAKSLAEDRVVTITHDAVGDQKCLDLSSDKKTLTFDTCSGKRSQKWRVETFKKKLNLIKNSSLPDDICLFSSTQGTLIEMRKCSEVTWTTQTHWEFTNDDEHYSIQSEVQRDYQRSGWLSADGGKLSLNDETLPTGKWHLSDSTASRPVAIVSTMAGPNHCMDLASDDKTIVFDVCTGSITQHWFIETSNGEYVTIKNNKLPEDICLFSTLDGKAVEMRPCKSGSYRSQTYWKLTPRLKGNYSIISKVQRDYVRNGELSVTEGRLVLNNVEASVGTWTVDGYALPRRKMRGTFSVLLLNTHFTGATEKPTDDIRKALFGGSGTYTSLSEYLALASGGTLTLKEGKTLDNLDIGTSGDTCNSTQYRDKAIELARAGGTNPDDYDVVYVEHSNNGKCGYAANATVPSKLDAPGKYIVSNASGHKYWMWSHEFGHTLGFKHSNILVNCPRTPTGVEINAECEIGGKDGGTNDLSDTMGGGGWRMYPVNYLYEAGWLSDEQFPIVGDGTYKIAPLLHDNGGKQGLRIARENPDFPFLTLEFRQPSLVDAEWPNDSPFVKGVIVREIRPTPMGSYNVIIHAEGGSDPKTPPLMPGKTLYDTYSGKVITVDATGADGATVTISDHATNGTRSEKD